LGNTLFSRSSRGFPKGKHVMFYTGNLPLSKGGKCPQFHPGIWRDDQNWNYKRYLAKELKTLVQKDTQEVVENFITNLVPLSTRTTGLSNGKSNKF